MYSVGDASVSDASVGDASVSDASVSDASASDASASDASASDASASDASVGDASECTVFIKYITCIRLDDRHESKQHGCHTRPVLVHTSLKISQTLKLMAPKCYYFNI